MLFSAGTFLYVATVHVLPEVGGIGHSHAPSGGSGGKGLSKVEVGALVLGCLIPLPVVSGSELVSLTCKLSPSERFPASSVDCANGDTPPLI
ncbi:hypothetical protein ANANG_G00024060 [Anguilla anguilla]|uniref:Zinc transporter ZIP9 n=1 Tax=Anguilla anguilla TaxID=7936 RepID=A0A9D3S7P7_ANGAN|nr:hypothetical protein ANANG_G00024060 [Anguilla anguilla]